MRKNIEEYLEKRAKDLAEEWKEGISYWIRKCKSPIEQLFIIEWYYQNEEAKNDPDGYPKLSAYPQYKINIEDKHYKVDFLIYYYKDDTFYLKKNGGPEYHKEQSIIVELDSYLWHGSAPEQFTKEKERERELQKEGWKIMRFSGREIIRNTEKCIEQIINYFTEKVKIKI